MQNSEAVKEFIASKKVINCRKRNLVKAYNYYVVCLGLAWEKPRYKVTTRLPNISTEEQLAKVIASASKRYAVIFTILKETGEISRAEIMLVPLNGDSPDKGRLRKR